MCLTTLAASSSTIHCFGDSDIPDTMFGKGNIREHPYHRGVSSEAGQVLCDTDSDVIRFDFCQHLLKARTVKVGSTVQMRGGEKPFSGFYTILYLAFDKSGLL